MNDKKAHSKLKEINKQRNTIGVGGFKNSRRDRCEQHEKFNGAMNEMAELSDKEKMKTMRSDSLGNSI